MSLGEGNKFGIISPTHNFKLVTRLQHVSHAVRAASRPADNNRTRDKIGRLSATCDDILCCFVCWLRRESGAYRPISMKSWPWRRHKIWIWSVACAEIEGEIANQIAHHSGIVTTNASALHLAFVGVMTSDSTTKCYSAGARAGKRNMARVGGFSLKLEEYKPYNEYRFDSEAAWRNTSWSGCVSSAQLPDFFMQRLCPPMAKVQAKRRAKRLLPAAEFSSKKNGFQGFRKISHLTLQSMIIYI